MLASFFAYIDPGSGSYFFQLLIAGLTTIVFFFATMKNRILGFFRRGKAKTSEEEPVPESAQREERKPETPALHQ
jgi:hypothetical protein